MTGMQRSPILLEPWIAARDRFLDSLDDSEKDTFKHASLENLLYATSAAQKDYKSSSKLRNAHTRLQPLFTAIEIYGKAIDVYSNMSQGILAPIWGSIRVLLAAANEFGKYFDKIVDMLCQIENALARFRIYEKLFQKHARMLQSLSLVYFDILEFCMQAREVFRGAGKRHTSVFLSSGSQKGLKTLWKPFEQQFRAVISRIQMHSNAADRDADISHMIEAAEARDLENRSRAALEERSKEDRRKRMLDQLSRIEHRSKHRKICQIRQPNSCGWVLDSPEFNDWLNLAQSSHLWIHGIAGAGKTFGMAAAIDKIASIAEKTDVLIYFYCDYLNANTLQATSIMGSLVKQLLLSTDITESIERRIKECLSHSEFETRTPDLSELADLLKTVMNAFRRVFIAIDGLDECDPLEQRQLTGVLKSLTELSQPTIKLLVCSRHEVEIAKVFEDGARLRLTGQLNMDDIYQYVKDTVTSRINSGDLVIGDDSIKGKIIQTLTEGAKGMFLWVTLQLDEVCEALDDHHRRQVLKELPRTLEETYARTLRKINESKSMRLVAQKIFRWIVCARRPLSHPELMEAVAFTAEDRCWNHSKIPQDPRLVGRACRNLVVKDEEEGTFSLAHYTVLQYFLSESQEVALNDFHFERHIADAKQIEKFSDSKTAYEAAANKNMKLLEASVQAGLVPTDFSRKSLSRIISRLHGRQLPQLPNIDYGHILCSTLVQPFSKVPPIFSKYSLLEYASENWVWHTTSLDSSSTSWQAFGRLALQRQSAFDFRMWGDSHFSKDMPYRSMFVWALEHGHGALLRLLYDPPLGRSLGAYLAYERQHERLGTRVFTSLAIRGEQRILNDIIGLFYSLGNSDRTFDFEDSVNLAAEVLIAFHAEDNPLDRHLRSGIDSHLVHVTFPDAIYWDLASQLILFALVTDKGRSLAPLASLMGISLPDNILGTSSTWMHVAVSWRCSIDTLKVLIDCRVRADGIDSNGRTPIHIAVMYESFEHVRCLLSHGVDPSALSGRGGDPIWTAIARRSHAILQLLLDAATVDREGNTRFFREKTYLHQAIEMVDVNAVNLLLEFGAYTEARDEKGDTPLLCLARLYASHDAYIFTPHGFTSHEEVLGSLELIFDLLIKSGAWTDAKGLGGLTHGKGIYWFASQGLEHGNRLTRDLRLLRKFKTCE